LPDKEITFIKSVMIRIFAFAFSVLIGSLGFSQNMILFENTQNESFVFKNYDNPNASQVISNYFIQEISKSLPKMLAYTSYTFSYSQYCRIVKEGAKEYGVEAELKDSKCFGDVTYKGFDIADVLIPTKMDLTVKVFYTSGALFKTTDIKGVSLNTGFNKIADFKMQDTTAAPLYKMTIENKSFYYENSGKELFDNRLRLVDEYYNSDAVIGVALQKLSLINLQDVDMVQVNDIKLDEVEVMVDQLMNKKYSEKLKLLMFDPIKFMQKFDDLNQQTKAKRMVLNQMLASLDQLYYNKGMEHLLNNNIPKAVSYFEKSIDINTFFAPSHYQLARINYNSGNLDKSVEIIKGIFLKMNPDPNTHTLILQLSTSIYNSYLARGQENIDGEKYNEAISDLTKAKDFCMTTPGIVCTDDLAKKLSIAKYGIYRSFLTVAAKSLSVGQLEMAEDYITDAKNYQKANSNEIITCTDADAMMGDVINAYIDKGLSFNSTLSFEKALINFNKATDLYKTVPGIAVNKKLKEGVVIAKSGNYRNDLIKASDFLDKKDLDKAENMLNLADAYQAANSNDITASSDSKTILNKVKHERYLKSIFDGRGFLLSGQPDSALIKFENARLLETAYIFEKDSKLDSLTKSAAKPIILKDIEAGKLKVWGNDLESARTIYSSVLAKQDKYKLKNDADLNKGIVELKNKIFTQECVNAQAEYDDDYSRAQKNISNKSFIDAISLLEAAIKVAESNTLCSISSKSAADDKFKYGPASNYQKLIKECDALLSGDKFSEVIEKHITAEKYFVQFDVQNFGLNNTPLAEYIEAQNNSNFISHCTGYYTDLKDYDQAMKLLKLLKQRNYPLNYVRTLQENLAAKIATRDHEKNPALNAKTNVLAYTNGDKWFKYFKTVYIKTYKKL
jgi:hypothetical protein